MQFRTFVLVILIGLGLAGCEGTEGREKQIAGSILGAVGGALIGSQIGGGSGSVIAATAGAVIGGVIGGKIGQSLDEKDKRAADKAQQKALNAPIGEKIAWSNPESGNRGSVTPVREGKRSTDGAYCREFQHEITVRENTEKSSGVVCRQPDGTWKIVQ